MPPAENKRNASQPPAIFLMGPTAAGKTGLAIVLSQRYPLDIISVDSAQVYRGMDIGTAKPDAATLAQAPHALIDIREPTETYSAAEFREDALREMNRAWNRGRVPLLAGGTMLYFRALSEGLAALPSADPELRGRLEQQGHSLGWAAMHAKLADLDPECAARIHSNDPQRIQRALEVIELTGRKMSELQAEQAEEPPGFRALKIIVCPSSREELHRRIELRFREMLELGFLDEVKTLRNLPGISRELPSMRCVGYRQAWSFLEGEIDFDEMCTRAVVATRQLAKRQLTWLRKEKDALWYDSTVRDTRAKVCDLVEKFLEI